MRSTYERFFGNTWYFHARGTQRPDTIAILAPVIGILIRKGDIRRQVTLKKPIREIKADEHVTDISSKDAYTEAECLKDEARMHRFRDSNGGSVMY